MNLLGFLSRLVFLQNLSSAMGQGGADFAFFSYIIRSSNTPAVQKTGVLLSANTFRSGCESSTRAHSGRLSFDALAILL